MQFQLIKTMSLALLITAPLVVAEESVNLDRAFLEHVQIEGGDASGEGLGFTTSFGESQNWVFGASYLSVDIDGLPVTSDAYQIGVGYASYGENSATVLSIGGGNTDVDFCVQSIGCASDSESFAFTSLDFIYNASDAIELTAGLGAQNFSDGDIGTVVTLDVGLNFYITDNVAFSIDVGTDDDDTTFAGIGLLYRF